jgi:SAM-dependent methyltransferase
MAVSVPEVVWHDLECGSYSADLPLWHELADRAAVDRQGARVLDVGAGSGRVAHSLAKAGHEVTALDLDAGLLEALRDRDAGASIDTICADARTFDLDRDDFDLCLMPMQTVQLLGGSEERVSFLKRARAHLRPGGLLALAIVTVVEPFDRAAGDPAPTPESVRIDGTLYVSRPTRVRLLADSILIERERLIYRDAERPGAEQQRGRVLVAPQAVLEEIALQRLDAPQLEREASGVGLTAEPALTLAETDDHVGGTVVVLRA